MRIFTLLALLLITSIARSQTINVSQRLKDIDKRVEKILKDWNVPGCGIGVVQKDKLVFAKGYGYRNIETKQPITPNTLFPIASNTKLITATAVGFLVEEGKLEWDQPVKKYSPQIQFYNDDLTSKVTMRDMLSHRTGISRHDNIWYNSDFNRQEIFDRIKYLEPSIPLRQGYLYNNIMYGAAGHIIYQLSGQTWEDYVRSKIFVPLNMNSSMFDTDEMRKQPDFVTSYYEKRDTNLLLMNPFYSKFNGVGPAGSIISNINDMSKWLIAQMNGGKFNGKAIIPSRVIRETMQPTALSSGVPDKYFENLNSMYGMGRSTSSYKGHYLTGHAGAIGGIYSYVSFMPYDSIGIIVFTNGAHISTLPAYISFTLYDKLLNVEQTPWSDRNLKDYLKRKQTEREARKKPDADRIPNTKPSHVLSDYVGVYEDRAYGTVDITQEADSLRFNFHGRKLPLHHYHYDRFVTTDSETDGKWSVNFATDAQGSVHQLKMSVDQQEVTFTKKPDKRLTDPEFLKKLTGAYELDGVTFNVAFANNELMFSTAPPQHLDPYKNTTFRIREFSDRTVEFVLDGSGNPTALKLTVNGQTYTYLRKM